MDLWREQLLQSRSALLRVARARLRNSDWAEDALSETLLAALEKPQAFEEPGRVRAWLFGTLRHKLTDQLRVGLGKLGHQSTEPDGATVDRASMVDISPYADPEQRASEAEFLTALDRQLQRLPPVQAQVFVMRECQGDGSAEICAALRITEGHLCVLQQRARSRLRTGLAQHL